MSSDLGIGGPAARQSASRLQHVPTWPFEVGRQAFPHRDRWETNYTALTIAVDVAAVSIAVIVGYMLGLGRTVPLFGDVAPGVGVLSGVLMLGSAFVCRAWDSRVLGQGSEEFSRLIRAVVTSAVTLGLLGLAFQALAARPWVFGLMPMAGVLSICGRLVLRWWLHRMRVDGRCAMPVLAVGTFECAEDLIDRTRRDTKRGWVISGVCTPTGAGRDGGATILGVPVLGDLDAVAEVARAARHRVVAVCATPGWTSRRLHQLAWSLEDVAAELVVDPGLMEVAGPRLHIEPVDGLPLLRLTRPTFTGTPWVVKHFMDRIGSVVLLLLVAPVLIAIAIVIKLDGGPVLFHQTRVGRHGREFTMLKFRSMVVGAEEQLDELLVANEGAGPMFKLKSDPRVTRIGAILRRHSLDELPQLFNVLSGAMSLVGPRPPLPSEVATYGRAAERRLLVKPGLTGLWQISGRSDLSWEQAVRLDLRYVENWNLALDALILWKTLGAVRSSRGAY